jgi:hypothetical protein
MAGAAFSGRCHQRVEPGKRAAKTVNAVGDDIKAELIEAICSPLVLIITLPVCAISGLITCAIKGLPASSAKGLRCLPFAGRGRRQDRQ